MTTQAGVLAYDSSKVGPGWIAFALLVVLCFATYFLWRSMNTQLGRIKVPPRASFRGRGGSTEPTGPDGQPLPPATQPPNDTDGQQ